MKQTTLSNYFKLKHDRFEKQSRVKYIVIYRKKM
jgi:hypothetical protein